jgi:hypothetical protein
MDNNKFLAKKQTTLSGHYLGNDYSNARLSPGCWEQTSSQTRRWNYDLADHILLFSLPSISQITNINLLKIKPTYQIWGNLKIVKCKDHGIGRYIHFLAFCSHFGTIPKPQLS